MQGLTEPAEQRQSGAGRTRDRILVVEDAEAITAMLVAILKDEGCDVVNVGSGVAALEVAEHAPPDVVLLDWQLPDMDGAEFAAAYRARSAAPAPIVLLSAEPGVAELGERIDAKAALAKPFVLDDLLNALRPYLDCIGPN